MGKQRIKEWQRKEAQRIAELELPEDLDDAIVIVMLLAAILEKANSSALTDLGVSLGLGL